MSASLVRHDARRAGDIVRYHTWPVAQPQTGAHHAWNVMRILITIWPDAPADVLRFALFHDAGELGPGDVPFPYKAKDPVMKERHDVAEVSSLKAQGIKLPELDKYWAWRVKTCDLVEMLEKGLDEVALGNKFGGPIVTQIGEVLQQRLQFLASDKMYPEAKRVRTYLSRRLTQWGRLMQVEQQFNFGGLVHD